MHRRGLSVILTVAISLILFSSISAWADPEHNLISTKIGPLLHQTIKKHDSSSLTQLEKVIVVMNRDHLKPLPEELIAEIKKRVEDLGGFIGNHAYNNVQVWIPIDKIEILAEWFEIKMINNPLKPSVNNTISEGGGLIGTYQWHSYGLTGKGVKVGIIDLGFKGYDSLLGVELPTYVTTKVMGNYSNFISDPHGTACAEIIHDMVPEAELFLVNIADADVDFQNAVIWLQSQGVNVISSSIAINLLNYAELVYLALNSSNLSYIQSQFLYFGNLKDQWRSIVNTAVLNGIPWSQAAGNNGKQLWLGPFVDYDNDLLLDFAPQMPFNEIILPSNFKYGKSIYLILSWGGNNNYITTDDYDIGIMDEYGNFPECSLLDQSKISVGFEACKLTPIPGVRYFVYVYKMRATPQKIGLLMGIDDFSSFKYWNPQASIPLSPPADSEKVITVGAVGYKNPVSIEDYSSQGPVGDLIKPDLVAPDCVSTSSYQSPFCGTSAAAPHVAGLIALLKQAYPGWSPSQIKSFLESWAYDLGTKGKDNVYGSGLVQLPLPVFTDVILGHWAFFNTLGIYYAGITTGCSQNPPLYCPDNYVTREQMAVFITKALNQMPPDGYCGGTNPFTDVNYNRWSCKYIKKFMELGITSGYGDGRFGPDDSVTREQMAVFITKALAAVPQDGYCGTTSPFTDVSYNRWSCKYVKKFTELGITAGYGDGRYGPVDYVTRAQMAVFLSRAFLGM